MIWWWLGLFILLLVGGFILFLIMEKISGISRTDDLNTLSWYLKRARRRAKFLGYVVLFAVIFAPTIWLFLHLSEIGPFAWII